MRHTLYAKIKHIYENKASLNLALHPSHVAEAATIVQRTFPPATPSDTFRILAALNLLNAAIKLPWGKRLVSYNYIKGMAAKLFVHLTLHPQPHTHIYYSPQEQVTYFRILGVQISFHYLPHSKVLQMLQRQYPAEPQVWDGLRLQEVALELFRLAVPAEKLSVEHLEVKEVADRLSIPPPLTLCIRKRERKRIPLTHVFGEDKLTSLRHALNFNIWTATSFTLFRRKDQKILRFVRYDGHNYPQLLNTLVSSHSRIARRGENTLELGKIYYISPRLRLCSLPRSNYIITLTQNSYLLHEGNYSNLCVTWYIAAYLASLYPELLFVNTLEYNRRHNDRKYYTYPHLLAVPLGADERKMKVWLIVDTNYTLHDFSTDALPRPLIEEYLAAEDYYQEFQFIRCNGLLGIIAYRRHILLPPLYSRIELRNYHARVMRPDGKWAIYSLGQETFLTDFIYDRIWYDPDRYIIYGSVCGQQQVIYSFFR